MKRLCKQRQDMVIKTGSAHVAKILMYQYETDNTDTASQITKR
jgi:hypothetical protein